MHNLTDSKAGFRARLKALHHQFCNHIPPYRWISGIFQQRLFVIAPPYLWLLLFFFVPFLILLRVSFTEAAIASPPFSELIEWSESGIMAITINFLNYVDIWLEPIYRHAYFNSIKIAFFSMLLTLIIGYPIALAMARASRKWQPFLVMLIILPFWTSFLIRVYAWVTILSPTGILNNFINFVGVSLNLVDPDNPITLHLLHTDYAVYIGIIYGYLPFMILPLYATLTKMDDSLIEAALDLGSPPLKTFWTITFRLSMPGIFAGCFLVFIPAMGEFVIPDLLGGSNVTMIGKVLYDTYLQGMDLPMVSAIAVILMLIIIGPILFFNSLQNKQFS